MFERARKNTIFTMLLGLLIFLVSLGGVLLSSKTALRASAAEETTVLSSEGEAVATNTTTWGMEIDYIIDSDYYFNVTIPEEYIALLDEGKVQVSSKDMNAYGTLKSNKYMEYYLAVSVVDNLSDYNTGNSSTYMLFLTDKNGQMLDDSYLLSKYLQNGVLKIPANDIANRNTSAYTKTKYFFMSLIKLEYSKYVGWPQIMLPTLPDPTETWEEKSGYTSFTDAEIARESYNRVTELNLTQNQVDSLKVIAGDFSQTATVPITVNYWDTLLQDSKALQTGKSFTFEVTRDTASSKSAVLSTLYAMTGQTPEQVDLGDVKDCHYFDVKKKSDYVEELNGKTMYYDVKEYVVFQVDETGGTLGFNYEIQKSGTTITGATLTPIYSQFYAKDLVMEIRAVDTEDNTTNYVVDYKSSTITSNGDGTTSITFSYADIQRHLGNGLNWVLDLDNIDFNYNTKDYGGDGDGVSVIQDKENQAIVVTVDTEKQDELAWLGLNIKTNLQYDHEVEYTVAYKALSGINRFDGGELGRLQTVSIKVDDKRLQGAGKYKYLKFQNFTNMVNFETLPEYEQILAALSPEWLTGATYYEIAGVDIIRNDELTTWFSIIDEDGVEHWYIDKGVYELRVRYDVNALIAVREFVGGFETIDSIKFVDATNTLVYKGSDIFNTNDIKTGYRVANIHVPNDGLLLVTPSKVYADDYAETTIKLQRLSSTEPYIYTVAMEMSDTYIYEIHYLTEYEDLRYKLNPSSELKPCFATPAQSTFELKYSNGDIADLNNPTQDELCRLLNRQSLAVLGIAGVKQDGGITVTYNPTAGKYTVKIAYGGASLKLMDNAGNADEKVVYLTDYASWCQEVGKDWTIMWLNVQSGNKYFANTEDIKKENLYGFFGMINMKEQVSDLNHWLRQEAEYGFITVFSTVEARGSYIYETCKKLDDKFVMPTAAFNIAMAIEELKDNSNGIYYTYYFFLDGTVSEPYFGANGATSATDDDNATTNWMQKFFTWFNDSVNSEGCQGCGAAGAVIVIVLLVLLVIVLIKKLIDWITGKNKGGSTTNVNISNGGGSRTGQAYKKPYYRKKQKNNKKYKK